MLIEGKPHVVIFATKSIDIGTELRYDYGTGRLLQWRKVKSFDSSNNIEDFFSFAV